MTLTETTVTPGSSECDHFWREESQRTPYGVYFIQVCDDCDSERCIAYIADRHE